MSVSLEEQIAAVAEASLRPPAPDVVDAHPGERRLERGRGLWLATAACLVVVLGLGAVLVLGNDRPDPAPVTSTPAVTAGPVDPSAGPPWDMVGRQALDFTGTAPDGSTVMLSAMRGSWVIVDFSSTSCAPCRRQTPELLGLTGARPDVKIITVTLSDDLTAMDSLLTSQGVSWPIVAVSAITLGDLHVTGLPTTFVVNPEGTVTKVLEGFIESSQLEPSTEEPPVGLVEIRLSAMGGPVDSSMPVPGSVSLSSPGNDFTVRVPSDGIWRGHLPVGTYTFVRASSPNVDDGQLPCAPIDSTLTVAEGALQTLEVHCQIR